MSLVFERCMTTLRTCLLFSSAVMLVLTTACGPRRREITDRDRKEASVLASDAQFAMTLRDWSRAEASFAKAAAIVPDADLWLGLGAARVKLGNRDGAKQAYQSALKALDDEIARDGTSSEPWLRQSNVYALLGRLDESRAVLTKAQKRFPNDKRIQGLLDPAQFQKMISAPAFKEIAL